MANKTLIHIDDSPEALNVVSSALSPLEDLNIRQFTNKHDYLYSSGLEADLYLLDRVFPQRPGMKPDDNSWRELTGFLEQMFPDKGVLLLTTEVPNEDIWRQFSNIRAAFQKSIVFRNLPYLRDTIKHYLDESP